MEQENHNNNPDGSGDVPLKRKRGRPRKYPRADLEEGPHILPGQSSVQNPVRDEHTPVPPGFVGVNGNQHLQRGQENDSRDALVSQVVSGVIEAVFDAGYLLSVRVGDSDTTLRGVVFKPGRYVPISPENDVAPGVPMVQRNEVPFPSRTTQVPTPLPKEKNEQPVHAFRIEGLPMNGSPTVPPGPRATVNSSNLVPCSGKSVPSMTGQTSHPLPRGNMVPVLLQPNNFSNGLQVSNQTSQVAPVSQRGGAIVSIEVPVDGNQELTSQAQTTQNTLPSGIQHGDVPHHQSSSNVPHHDVDQTMRIPDMPFEQLFTEVVKRIETPSDSMNTEAEKCKLGDKVNDGDQPVLNKPLQDVESHLQENSAPKPSDCTETGKMSELLQVKQGFDLLIFVRNII